MATTIPLIELNREQLAGRLYNEIIMNGARWGFGRGKPPTEVLDLLEEVARIMIPNEEAE